MNSFVIYFTVLIEYGFQLSATRRVAVHRDDKMRVSQVAADVWFAKAILGLLSVCAMSVFVMLVPKLRENAHLVFILCGVAAGHVLFPGWLFQGMERMAIASAVNMVTRVGAAALIILAVRDPGDCSLYAGILSGQWLLSGAAAALLGYCTLGIVPKRPSFSGAWDALREGGVLFLSTGATTLYTGGGAFLMGFVADDTAVGYYSAAEKYVRAGAGLVTPITQAMYPRMSRLASVCAARALATARKALVAMSAIGFTVSACFVILAGVIAGAGMGPGFGHAATTVRLLAPVCFLTAASSVLGQQLMLPLGQDSAYTRIYGLAAAVSMALIIVLSSVWADRGMAVAVVLTEAFVVVAMAGRLRKQGALSSTSIRLSATSEER